MSRLPDGDILMHVVADFTLPSGARIEGRGAIPDELVPLTRTDLLAGRDAPLAAALRWIGQVPPTRASATPSP
jgi:carboxyl-terminal processing protease